jgi:serine/threonine-protein kinase
MLFPLPPLEWVMTTNPYASPQAPVALPPVAEEIPASIAKKIRNAWIAGCISAGITIVFTLASMFGNQSILKLDAWAFIDVVIILGLAYGVYRKSRTCAILMLAFFAFNKIVMWMDAGKPTGLLMALIFFWFYAQGIVGTVRFHRWKRSAAENAKS